MNEPIPEHLKTRTLSHAQLCERWDCIPEGITYAIDNNIIPEPVNGAWKVEDIHAAERKNYDPHNIADRIARLGALKHRASDGKYRTEANAVLTALVTEFACTPYFYDAMALFNDATGAVRHE